jgi:hypothetical protein
MHLGDGRESVYGKGIRRPADDHLVGALVGNVVRLAFDSGNGNTDRVPFALLL